MISLSNFAAWLWSWSGRAIYCHAEGHVPEWAGADEAEGAEHYIISAAGFLRHLLTGIHQWHLHWCELIASCRHAVLSHAKSMAESHLTVILA